MSQWNTEKARELYSIRHWSEGYFDVGDNGHLIARPRRDEGVAVDLAEVVARAREAGLAPPLLVRFLDILADRVRRMARAFDSAMASDGYRGGFTAVYPIKVNQQQSVVEELVRGADSRIGLEAGSKSELLAVLAQSPPGGIVICNGYKDRDYVRLALIGRQLGLRTFLVVEKLGELEMMLAEADRLGVRPALGVRMRLASLGRGNWQNTGGDKAKFGLSAGQVLEAVDVLRRAGLGDCLELLHFHMGSQISNVRDIQRGMREAARYFVELSRLGLAIRYMDVGGGLGVDYEGTRSRSFCSMNYGLDQYAATIVRTISEACDAAGLDHPHVITESGRAMTAHHAVLATDVSASEPAPPGRAGDPPGEGDPRVLHDLRKTLDALSGRPPLEVYHEAQHYLSEGQSMYIHGLLGLADRARLEQLYYAVCYGVRDRLKPEVRAHREVIDELRERLAEKYFCNFSVFQSVPDVWAIEQVFPIVPLQRLDERPDRRAVIEDLTCDSDGRIDHYVEQEELEATLPVHSLKTGEPYLLGLFMVGAYQETLGDIHNLFGDTDAIDVRLTDGGYELEHPRRGDTAGRVLGYVGFEPEALSSRLHGRLEDADLDDDNRRRALDAVERALAGGTYLTNE